MQDDLRNDWLAQELREENYQGCLNHAGEHQAKQGKDSVPKEEQRSAFDWRQYRSGQSDRRRRENNHYGEPQKRAITPGKLVGWVVLIYLAATLLLPFLPLLVHRLLGIMPL